MTMQAPKSANAVAPRFEIEDFKSFAFSELEAAPLWQPGVCFLPECGCVFTPSRPWQIYCCDACKRADTAEFRRIGHKVALPLLVWRVGKYEREDEAILARTKAARRFVTQVQTGMMRDRVARMATRGQG